MITHLDHQVTARVPRPTHIGTEYLIECGETKVYIRKRNPEDHEDNTWNFLNTTEPNLQLAISAAARYVEDREVKRMLHEKVDEL